jgi:hypothetical protein
MMTLEDALWCFEVYQRPRYFTGLLFWGKNITPVRGEGIR